MITKFIQTLAVIALVTGGAFDQPTARSENLGILREQSDLGSIAGNGMSWDYVLLFELRGSDRALRAISEVEGAVNASGTDTVVAIGAIDRCVIASIKTTGDRGQLLSRYSGATRAGELRRVSDFETFNGSKLVTNVIFGDAPMMRLCS